MTLIEIGPATQLNIVVIDGNTEADRQTPMYSRPPDPLSETIGEPTGLQQCSTSE